jgi:selenocysteine lyase/cysteine desulfurase
MKGKDASLRMHFDHFRRNIIGINQSIRTPYHDSIPLLYADWTASGRLYSEIETAFIERIYPLVANTHTDTTDTGMAMTYAYHKAQAIIKAHVGAGKNDILISSDSGMTGVVNKFQRILGLKLHERFKDSFQMKEEDRPVVFVSHMEHHSNQTSWVETIAEVVVVPPNEEGLVDVKIFEKYLNQYSERKHKIAAITSCSNVTGIMTPYMDIAALVHRHGGYCFVDFACSAPYIDMNMHEDDSEGRYLDAMYFSPHKFLGGPGSSGILIFNDNLYTNRIPDHPGGGTVDWTNPWGQHKFIDNIEAREDGGTPAFLQTMRAAMSCQLKEQMGVEMIHAREKEILDRIWACFDQIPSLHILADNQRERLGVISFYIDDLHYNLGVKILNDRFGIQTRGGCSCAGTYGHFLLNVDPEYSREITDLISSGDCSTKPGWIRMSIHPTHTDEEIDFLCDAITSLAQYHKEWSEDYDVDFALGQIRHKTGDQIPEMMNEVNEILALRQVPSLID